MSVPFATSLLSSSSLGLAAAMPQAIEAGQELLEGLDFAGLLAGKSKGDESEAIEENAATGFQPLNDAGLSPTQKLERLREAVAAIQQLLQDRGLAGQADLTLRSDGFGRLQLNGAGSARAELEARLNNDPEATALFRELFDALRAVDPSQASLASGLEIATPGKLAAVQRGDEAARLEDFSLELQGARLRARLD